MNPSERLMSSEHDQDQAHTGPSNASRHVEYERFRQAFLPGGPVPIVEMLGQRPGEWPRGREQW